jgi:hypothetical protein
MWWIDVFGIAAACAGWILIPRWADFTTRFYRERGLSATAPPLIGATFTVAVRAACAVIAVFATVDLIRNLT